MKHTSETGYRYTLSVKSGADTSETTVKFASVDDTIEYAKTTSLTRCGEITITDHSDNPYTVRFTAEGFTVTITPPRGNSLETLRDAALQHIRYSIGAHFNYNDFLAVDSIYRMTVTELIAVATMNDGEMANRWACEYRATDNEPPGNPAKNE